MPNYQNSLIYKLYCKDTNITDFYIGSTTSFRRRKAHHKSSCNNEKSGKYNYDVYKFIRENGGWVNWDMVLVEYYKCDTKLELEKREREVIKNLKPTLNRFIPTRTHKEYYQDNKEKIKEKLKEYYQENKEQILEKQKDYYEDNKEKIKQYQQDNKEQIKQYRQDNKEYYKEKRKKYRQENKQQLLEKNKQYYQDNKEKIKEKTKEKITCECGSIITKCQFNRHTKSIKHQGYIILKNNIHNI